MYYQRALLHSLYRSSSAQCRITHYIIVQYNTIQYNSVKYNTIQYNTVQYILYNTIKKSQYITVMMLRPQYILNNKKIQYIITDN